MAEILIKGRRESIKKPDSVARIIKQHWLGDDEAKIPKKPPSASLDLGDEWSGYYGDIRSIEIQPQYKVAVSVSEPELSENQRKANLHRIQVIRVNLGRMRQGLPPLPFTVKKEELSSNQ